MGALRWGIALADRTGARVIALNCLQPPYAEVSPSDHNRLVAERVREVDDWLSSAGVTDVERLVRMGDPRRLLNDVAVELGADVVVLGRSRRGPGFLHVSSVAEHVAHHTAVPLAVVLDGQRSPVDIVVGLDGSRGSEVALAWVAELLTEGSATVVGVRVTDDADPETVAEVRASVEQSLAPLRESGVSTEALVMTDIAAADALVGVSASRDADVLVLGTRGLGGFTGLRVGGVALKVLHHAPLTLVLVPSE
ncbi:MAG: universal stress protein [Acidimicrobiales bacterium]|nr:universal stress protein [Acidimicrobiales bacterium]